MTCSHTFLISHAAIGSKQHRAQIPDRAPWEKIKAEDQRMTEVSYAVFGLVKNAVAVGGRGEG